MSINLVTYANQTVTPTNDAIIYERAIDQNGIFYGCNVTVSGNEVHITGGYGIVCGREFTIESEAIAVTLAPSGTLDGRLYVRLDLADADAPIQLLTATGNTLPPLEQDADVNYTNGTWEMELATFTVGVSALSDVAETYETIVGNKTAIQPLEFKVASVTTGTTTNGSIQVFDITFFYNETIAFANGRIGLQNVTANVRPSITITVPEEMPTFDIQGGSAIRGSASSMQPTDPAHITHTKGDASAYINFYNYVGQVPAGFIETTF